MSGKIVGTFVDHEERMVENVPETGAMEARKMMQVVGIEKGNDEFDYIMDVYNEGRRMVCHRGNTNELKRSE